MTNTKLSIRSGYIFGNVGGQRFLILNAQGGNINYATSGKREIWMQIYRNRDRRWFIEKQVIARSLEYMGVASAQVLERTRRKFM